MFRFKISSKTKPKLFKPNQIFSSMKKRYLHRHHPSFVLLMRLFHSFGSSLDECLNQLLGFGSDAANRPLALAALQLWSWIIQWPWPNLDIPLVRLPTAIYFNQNFVPKLVSMRRSQNVNDWIVYLFRFVCTIWWFINC